MGSKSRRSVSPDRKKRKRHSRSPLGHRRRHEGRDKHDSHSDRRYASSDSSSDHHKRRHKKHKKIRSTRHQKKHKPTLSAVGDQWGKYGIIHEAESSWLIEVKTANVETLSNSKRKDMFIDFMEDYNTATMPHEKFYNLHAWERRQEALRMGESITMTSEEFDFKKDEEQLRLQHRQAARAKSSRQPALQLTKEKIEELARVNRERIEADRMRKMGLTPKEGMGVLYEYEEI
ncbi:uncharacterized protein B0P05DRAFT_527912 [Gilbertella persicaria]|uniref:uncharacterized protein n=1 Tax=Gilbertella persicaria TaxID=101096 RepID=UPI00221F7FDE|nr:uncharacterized protein B0P05DRAFT_527912 [Gilbertella persicaria]KAI8090906.1 hypothetical protein B0P05DRAFT_527912 [Gilbertella persicaria]